MMSSMQWVDRLHLKKVDQPNLHPSVSEQVLN